MACIDPGVQKDPEKDADKAKAKGSDGMTTGIVFIIDTTKSMKPYIDQTREIIRTVYDRLQKSPAKDKVAIAVVAFRSNVEKRPDSRSHSTSPLPAAGPAHQRRRPPTPSTKTPLPA